MRAPLIPMLLAGASAAAVAGPALAGGCTSGCPTTTPTACSSCNLPTTHQIYVPGVTVTPPNIVIRPPSVIGGVGGSVSGGVDVGIDVTTSSSASASSSAYASAVSATQSYAAGISNAQAANLLAATSSSSGGGGGGSGFFSDSGSSSNIPSLIVETPGAPPPPPPATRRICLEQKAVFRAIAIQAVCLDDKAVPHPASQTFPDRDVADAYEGEIYRCVAGSHMQYVIAEWNGQARFDHGQTAVCEKNESLWRGPAGRLQCRPQTPARDCNERSLLRRFGAGLKVVKAGGAQQCVRWSDSAVEAQQTVVAPVGQSFTMDGGVG